MSRVCCFLMSINVGSRVGLRVEFWTGFLSTGFRMEFLFMGSRSVLPLLILFLLVFLLDFSLLSPTHYSIFHYSPLPHIISLHSIFLNCISLNSISPTTALSSPLVLPLRPSPPHGVPTASSLPTQTAGAAHHPDPPILVLETQYGCLVEGPFSDGGCFGLKKKIANPPVPFETPVLKDDDSAIPAETLLK